MTNQPHQAKIQNWLNNTTIFEIIKDRHCIDTIIQDIESENGHTNIEILQFVNIFFLYQKLDKQRQEVVHKISQTDDLGERLKIGETLTKIENEEKQFLKNVLYTAHSFTDMKLEGTMENVAKSFFKGNIEEANNFLNSQQLTNNQDKSLQLIQEKVKLEQAYDKLEDNANEFKIKAQLTILNLDIENADDRFEKTISFFERGRLSAKITERKPFIGAYIFDYGFFLMENNVFEKAMSLFQETLAIHQKLSDYKPTIYASIIASVLNNIANLWSKVNQFEKAIVAYEEALIIRKKQASIQSSQYSKEIATLFHNLATSYQKNGKLTLAEKKFEEALLIRKKLRNTNPTIFDKAIGETLNNLAIVQMNKGEFKKAEISFLKALEVRQSLQPTNHKKNSDIAETFNNIGVLHYRLRQLEKAEPAFEEALVIRRELAKFNPQSFLPNLGSTLNNLSVLSHDLKKIKKAEQYYEEALSTRRFLASKNPKMFSPALAETLHNSGNLFAYFNKSKEAEEHYLEAFKIREELAKLNPNIYIPLVGDTLNNMATLKQDKDEMYQAMEIYEKSLKIYQSLHHGKSELYLNSFAITLSNLANLRRHLNEYGKAVELFRACLNIRRKLVKTNPNAQLPRLIDTLIIFGILLREKSKYDYLEAEKIFNEALALSLKAVEDNPQSYLYYLGSVQINLSLFYLKNKPNKDLSLKLVDEGMTNLMKLKPIPNDINEFSNIAIGILKEWGVNRFSFFWKKRFGSKKLK